MPSYNELVGLGHEHRADRRQELALLAASPSQPCPRCAAPMYATPAEARQAGLPPTFWHVDLDHYPGRIFGGPQVKRLMHRHCNRSSGATTGNRLRRLGIKRAIQKPRTRTIRRGRRSRW